jgi:hypothetical protein
MLALTWEGANNVQLSESNSSWYLFTCHFHTAYVLLNLYD